MKKHKHPKILMKTREKHRNAEDSLHNRKVVGDAFHKADELPNHLSLATH